ncbi:MAG TPA: hypothetical protein VMW10_01980 [Alphaproteobacteria bacterium]|nr:hypothetical protein [Alphaproteobacteria bacterium]
MMAVKTTQFSYDEEWLKRKNKTKVTWRQIMEAGIMALEEKKGITYKAPVSKVETEIATLKESPPPVPAEPPIEKPKVNIENVYYFKITKPGTVLTREFDMLATVFDGNNDYVRTWKPIPFDEIPLDAIFRVRDDGVVLNLAGYKRFRKISIIEHHEGIERAKVEVFKDVPIQA